MPHCGWCQDNYDIGHKGSASKHSEPLSMTFPSLYAFFKDMAFLGLILLLAFMCEKYPMHAQGGKTWDRDMYWFLCLLLLLWSIGTMKKVREIRWCRWLPYESDYQWTFVCLALTLQGKSTDILNRDQTEEWKGWMQFMFLMYHYYHAEEVYNAIRIMITCYVWMTGFGNFSFFYIKQVRRPRQARADDKALKPMCAKPPRQFLVPLCFLVCVQDFGVVRMLQMLWRLNFLVTLLCMSQANTYILYYICPLHTFYFFLVYATMRVLPQCNHGKWDVRVKLMGVAILIYLIWDCFKGRLFSLFFSPLLGTEPTIGANSGSLWEWYFRTSLDHWSTLFGMIFALNFPLATKLLNRTEDLPLGSQVMVKGVAGAALGGALCWWTWSIFMLPKVEYNHSNAYYGWIPLLAYIYFRNLTPSMRMWYSGGLHEIGKVTLETYLMQHHIWLTSNAKTLLVLLPGYPKINMLLATLLFLFVSKQLYYITMSLRGMVLPDDRRRCLLGTAATVLLLLGSYVLGLVIKATSMGMVGVLIVTLLISISLVSYLHRKANLWSQGVPGAGSPHVLSGCSTEATKSVAVAGAMVTLFVLLMAMPFRSLPPAVPSKPAINSSAVVATGPTALTAGSRGPSECLKLINKGSWQTDDDCEDKGQGLGADLQAACGMESWEWDASTSSCHFHKLDATEFQGLLHGKRIAVVGDSVTRNVYWSLLGAAGYSNPAAQDGSSQEKHKDLHFQAPNGAFNATFHWRPYAGDVQNQLRRWLSGVDPSPPDVLLVGLGLWDTLHKRNVQDFKERMGSVKQDMGGLQAMVDFRVWLLPTAIVDSRLTNQDKIEHMSESHVQAYRDVITDDVDMGGAVDAMLDGHALTKSVAGRSHDGVHYDDLTYTAISQVLGNALAVYSERAEPPPKLWSTGKDEGAVERDPLPTLPLHAHDDHRVLKKNMPREVDGTMSSPGHGAFILLVVFLMLVTMDSYGGVFKFAMRIFSEFHVTWEEAYEPLLSRIHRPAPAAPARAGGGSATGVSGKYTPVPQQDVELTEINDNEEAT